MAVMGVSAVSSGDSTVALAWGGWPAGEGLAATVAALAMARAMVMGMALAMVTRMEMVM